MRDDFFLHSVFSQPEFWSDEECRQFRELAKFSPSEEAGIYMEGSQGTNLQFRKTRRILLNHSIMQEMQRSILTIKPRLEHYFGLSLSGLQLCQLLQYREGDYFRPHQDEREAVSNVSRKISVIIFLNSKTANQETAFDGGDVVFYEDMDHNLKREGFCFPAQQGLLLAFSSYLLHEVTEITKGIRYSIVTWFF